MTWHHIVYFVSLIITTLVMAFIAWYSWRKRTAVPEAGIYQWISFFISLLALLQLMSMIVPSNGLPLVFFNLRYVSTAVIPLLWLVFVLRYTGKRSKFPGPLMAVMAVIPLVTQIMIWTNDFHGIWVLSEVEFYQVGPLIFPETSTRVYGPWYLVHNIYSFGLTLVGIVILFVETIRMPREYRKQSIIIITGTMIMVIGIFFPSVNLVPGMNLNPLPQSFAIGSLVMAWAIFHYRFLSITPRIDRNKPVPVALVTIFLSLAAAITIIGFLYYHQYREQFRLQVGHQLLSIADLKVKDIDRWRLERLGDGSILHGNAVFNNLARRYLSDPGDGNARWQINSWLGNILEVYKYEAIVLLDARGTAQLSVRDIKGLMCEHLKGFLDDSRRAGKVILSDFYTDAPGKPIRLFVIVPLSEGQGGVSPFGYVLLVINPDEYLYPMLNTWPVPSPTAESFLVRKDGDHVLYLSDLRFKKNMAMNFRKPLTEHNLAAVKAVLGKDGIMETIDYRGIPTIAALKAVPGTPWFMVAHQSAEEVFKPVRERFWTMGVIITIMIAAMGVGVLLIWNRQEDKNIRQRLKSAKLLRKQETRYHLLADHVTEIVWTTDMDLKTTYISPSVEKTLGYSFEELREMSLEKILTPESLEIATQALNDGKARMGVDPSYSTRRSLDLEMYRKDGTSLWCEITFSFIRDEEGESVSILVEARDITKRKRSEDALRESEQRFRILADSMPQLVWTANPDGTLDYINSKHVEFGGLQRDDTHAWQGSRSLHPDDMRLTLASWRRSIDTGCEYEIEHRLLTGSGDFRWFLSRSVPVRNADGAIVKWYGTSTDIHDRKLAEAQREEAFSALQESQEKYRLISENMSDVIWLMDMSLKYIFATPSLEQSLGYTMEELNAKPLDHIFTPESSALLRQAMAEELVPERLDSRDTVISRTLALESIRKDGSRFWGEIRYELIRDADGRPKAILGVARNINERKGAEEKIAASLREKEVLLREVHHRVKNNMQIISSLLTIQNTYLTKGADVRVALQEMQNRIKSMSIVHEKLYRSENLAQIDFRDYIVSLSASVFQSIGIDTGRIEFKIDKETIILNIDVAISCGLLINELVTNALKHAFPDGREGVIAVSMGESSGGSYRISVKDNGIGLPEGFDINTRGTMGMRLIGVLTRQIGGTIEVHHEKETEFIIQFPIAKEDMKDGRS